MQFDSLDFYRVHAQRYSRLSHEFTHSVYTGSSHPALRGDLDLLNRVTELAWGKRVQDAGCGAGARDVHLLYTLGYDVYGIDAVEENISQGRELHPEIADKLSVADLRIKGSQSERRLTPSPPPKATLALKARLGFLRSLDVSHSSLTATAAFSVGEGISPNHLASFLGPPLGTKAIQHSSCTWLSRQVGSPSLAFADLPGWQLHLFQIDCFSRGKVGHGSVESLQ